jgi:hypothetical protein
MYHRQSGSFSSRVLLLTKVRATPPPRTLFRLTPDISKNCQDPTPKSKGQISPDVRYTEKAVTGRSVDYVRAVSPEGNDMALWILFLIYVFGPTRMMTWPFGTAGSVVALNPSFTPSYIFMNAVQRAPGNCDLSSKLSRGEQINSTSEFPIGLPLGDLRTGTPTGLDIPHPVAMFITYASVPAKALVSGLLSKNLIVKSPGFGFGTPASAFWKTGRGTPRASCLCMTLASWISAPANVVSAAVSLSDSYERIAVSALEAKTSNITSPATPAITRISPKADRGIRQLLGLSASGRPPLLAWHQLLRLWTVSHNSKPQPMATMAPEIQTHRNHLALIDSSLSRSGSGGVEDVIAERNRETRWFLIGLACWGAVVICGVVYILFQPLCENEEGHRHGAFSEADEERKASRQKKTPDSL